MADTKETVRTDVEINAKAAIQQLRDMSREATSAEEAVAKFSSFLVTNSKKWLTPIAQLRQEFRLLNQELAGSKKATLFGNFGNQKIFDMEETFTASAQAAGRFQVSEEGVVTSINRGNKAMDSADRAARGYGHSIDIVRTAMGTLVAVGIFQFLSAVTEFFQGAVKSAREYEDSLYRIKNVEKELSGQGIEISVEGLRKGIADIKKLLPIFSKEDITGLVGGLAIKTKDLKYSEKQILDLAKAIGILNIRSTEMESLDQTTGKVVTALLSGSTKGISGLGLQMSDATIEAEAFKEGLLKAGESVSDLSKHEKDLVKLNIVLKSAGGEILSVNDYLNSSTGILQQNKAGWDDLKATVGTLLTALVPLTTGLTDFLMKGVNGFKALLVPILAVRAAIIDFRNVWVGLIADFKVGPREAGKQLLDAFKGIPEQIKKNLAIKAKDLFPEGAPSGAPKWFENLVGKYLKGPDTPTNFLAGSAAATDEEAKKVTKTVEDVSSKLIDIQQEAADKRAQIETDYQRKIEDAYRDHSEKLADIARDVARKQEDALRNYNQKVEDINRDADQKVADAKNDQRQKDLDREAEYQNKLRELREKLLFDLEDALRERDARQVLRLIREYNMDKKNLEEKHKLDRQQAKKDLADKLADIERDRQLKLEAAQRELAEKQAEINLWAERERADAALALQRKLADARLWHQRELADYNNYLKQKLQALANEIAKEYELTAAGANAIYKLLQGYYGSGGAISGIFNGLQTSLQGIISGYSSSSTSSGGSSVPSGFVGSGLYGTYAEGGTIIANRPTKAIFGERGPERVDITPLNRVGSDVGKVFGDVSGMSGAGGNLNLRLALSPDLVAEIVDTSLDSVAVHIEKLTREKG